MGSVLNERVAQRPPHTLGVYELHHTASGRRLVGVARDIAHTKYHTLRLLAAGLHTNQELQQAYNENQVLEFVFYPCPTLAYAQGMAQEITQELLPSGRLFEEPQRYLQPVHPTPSKYDA